MERKIENSVKTSRPRQIAAACIVLAGFCLVGGFFVVGLTDKNAAQRDFIEYWAAGQQLAHGANPYDRVAVFRLQLQAGLDENEPKIVPSPPVAAFVVIPLGFVSPKIGLVIWLLVQIACLAISVWIMWILQGRPTSRWHLFGFLFPPALACLMAGQLGIFILLGLMLFFLLHRVRPFLAGAALLPCTLKPHLLVPFAVVMLVWIVSSKAWRVAAGFIVALIASCGLTLFFDPQVWSQYRETMGASRFLDVLIPTVSMAFRFLIDRHAVWLQFLPEVAGCSWGIWYFWTRRDGWDWMNQGMLVLLVSALCSPYGFFNDEAILLPAVLVGVYRAVDSRCSLWPIAIIAGAALIEVLDLVKLTSLYYLWTVPAWLGWYLYATHKTKWNAAEVVASGR
jgi:hypothetical protein